ncbi:MAG: RsmE family RNA methyltransferase [Polyangiaceae bacterium]
MARQVRVFVAELAAGRRELPREQAHYLGVVHRLGVGAPFVAFDPELGLEAEGSVVRSERGRVECELSEPRAAHKRSLGVTLLQGASKGDRLEQVVRAGTALGVERVLVVACERSVTQPSDLRRERLRSIALEAARQSGRGDLPRLDGPDALPEALDRARSEPGLKLYLSPSSEAPFSERITAWRAGDPVQLLVGPEGGLSEVELELAEAAGFRDASLGPFVLRTELAAIAALSCFVGRLAATIG